jgi:hypothetical protein
MHDATIEACDHPWLERLCEKLASEDETDVRHCRALEYFYRAWPLKPNESFSHIFMAMDSIFGDASRATQAVIEAATKWHGNSPLRATQAASEPARHRYSWRRAGRPRFR